MGLIPFLEVAGVLLGASVCAFGSNPSEDELPHRPRTENRVLSTGPTKKKMPNEQGRRERGHAMYETPAPRLCRTEVKSNCWEVGKAETIGRRRTMEDKMVVCAGFQGHQKVDVFVVFDGHGGSSAAEYAEQNIEKHLVQTLGPDFDKSSSEDILEALKECFIQLDKEINQHSWANVCGTTAVVALCVDQTLYIANVGDTRAVLCGRDMDVERLTVDHKPSVPEEKARIESLNGIVLNQRVNGSLAVSRALGDKQFQPWVTPVPHTRAVQLTPQHSFLILACDGLWDVFSDKIAAEMISGEKSAADAAEKLVNRAFASGSTDNISCLVIKRT